MITKAIIPVAGWGTRRLPITKAIEKCMLPIGNRPIVDYVVQDCIAAGITEIFFVVGGESTQIQQYYGTNHALNDYLVQNNKSDLLDDVTPINITVHYITQPTDGQYGTAIPVALAAEHLDKSESVVVLMGDDFIYNADGSSEVQRLIEATPDGESSMLAAQVDPKEVSRYGVIETNDDHDFVRIVEKPGVDEAPSNLINISKYILNPTMLQTIKEFAHSTKDGEYYITDPINQAVNAGETMKVVSARGQYLDGGNLEGWLHANNVIFTSVE